MSAGAADDQAGYGQDQYQAGPGPGLAKDRQRGGRARGPGQHRPLETTQVAAPASSQSGGQQRGRGGQHRPGPPGREPPRPGSGQQRECGDQRVEQQAGIRGGVGQRQSGRRRDHPPGRRLPGPGPDHAPGRQRDQEHRHRIVGGEYPQVHRGAEHGEQRHGEKRGSSSEQPGRGTPEQDRGAEHERQGQDPGTGQAADAVRRRADRRVDHRRTGKIRRERRDRDTVQPVRPFQMPGIQVQGLTLGGGISPEQPQ